MWKDGLGDGAGAGALPQEVRLKPARAATRARIVAIFIILICGLVLENGLKNKSVIVSVPENNILSSNLLTIMATNTAFARRYLRFFDIVVA